MSRDKWLRKRRSSGKDLRRQRVYTCELDDYVGNPRKYIVECEFVEVDDHSPIIAIKFRVASDAKSISNYSRLTGYRHIGKLLVTVAAIAQACLTDYPQASFCYLGVPRRDDVSGHAETAKRNGRFRLYESLLVQRLSSQPFGYYPIEELSAGLVMNDSATMSPDQAKAFLAWAYPNIDASLRLED